MVTRKQLLSALFDTINSNDYDDELGGWWHSKPLGENRWRIAFSAPVGDDEARDMAEWSVTIVVEDIIRTDDAPNLDTGARLTDS